ncbi:MAG TPA: Gfo/Idh/MocA family oxidoreductase [Micromonosporaceae bacterium]|nr:Gfo/Idh/MocA family oxidoreductase [Micromonosporaceae bacterium]
MHGMVVRWGILATGGIAAKFTEDLALLPGAEAVAVGSRTAAAAQAFAQRYGIPRAHGSWAELAADPEVDVVYLATPHSAHVAAALECIEAGKAVLVEKPMALDVPAAKDLVTAARSRGTFLMEAMWMRCLPGIRRLVELVDAGAIGEVTTVQADFGLAGPFPPEHRLRDPALGGGALLDLGIYPVSLAHLLLGNPVRLTATASLTPEGVDQNTAVILDYPNAMAVLHCGMVGATPGTASVTGTDGRIDLPPGFHRPQWLTVHRRGAAEPDVIEAPIDGWGYHIEAGEVGRCLSEGLLESPLVPLDTTLEVLAILDALRVQIGVEYP